MFEVHTGDEFTRGMEIPRVGEEQVYSRTRV